MDKRKLPRIEFKSDVELVNRDISIKGLAHDLSLSGMFVETVGILEPDTDVDVKISLGEKSNQLFVKIKGIIKRRDPNGLAVEFRDEKGLNKVLSQVLSSRGI